MASDLPSFWIVAILASVVVGLGKGGLPMVGMLGVPVMSLVLSPVTAAGLLLPVYVLSDMVGVWIYRRHFDRRVIGIMFAGGLIGILLGWSLIAVTPERLVLGLVGAIGLWFSLRTLLQRAGAVGAARPARLGPGLFWGTLMGFTSFICHVGAPPYQAYVQPLNLEKRIFAGTTTILFAAVNVVKLLPFWMLGQLSPQNLSVAAILCLPAAAAVFAGARLVAYVSPATFRRIITIMLLLVSVRLLIQAIFGV